MAFNGVLHGQLMGPAGVRVAIAVALACASCAVILDLDYEFGADAATGDLVGRDGAAGEDSTPAVAGAAPQEGTIQGSNDSRAGAATGRGSIPERDSGNALRFCVLNDAALSACTLR
jgi:hypothetical protein